MEDLRITHIQGGIKEFEKTGIYPTYLLFNQSGSFRNWRIKIHKTPQEGVLKSKGVVIYHYRFDGDWCEYRKVKADGSLSDWQAPECMEMEMRD